MRKFLVIIFCSLFSFNSFSSHLMGGEITWECLKTGPDAGKYIFTMKVYRDCSGISVSTITQVIQVWNHPTVTGIDVDFILQQDVSPLCDPSSSGNPQLDCASGDPGSVEEYIFQSQPVSLPGVPPTAGWQFTWDNCCRNAAITNVLNPSSAGFTLRASMFPLSIQQQEYQLLQNHALIHLLNLRNNQKLFCVQVSLFLTVTTLLMKNLMS